MTQTHDPGSDTIYRTSYAFPLQNQLVRDEEDTFKSFMTFNITPRGPILE